MLAGLKKIVKWTLTSLPVLSRLYFEYRLRKSPLDEKKLRGLIQYTAHAIDLQMGRGERVPAARIRELQCLLDTLSRRGLKADDPVLWAGGMLALAKYRLHYRGVEASRASGDSAATGSFPEIALAKAMMERRSVRQWTGDPVDLRDIRQCLELARWAPSSCNRQLWQTLIVQEASEKAFLADYFPNTFYAKAPLVIVVLIQCGTYGADDYQFAYLDGGAFIQNLLLALHAKGYGACWVGFKKWNTFGGKFIDPTVYEKFYEHFGLEKDKVPVSLIAVGRPTLIPKAPPRQGLEQIIISEPKKT